MLLKQYLILDYFDSLINSSNYVNNDLQIEQKESNTIVITAMPERSLIRTTADVDLQGYKFQFSCVNK